MCETFSFIIKIFFKKLGIQTFGLLAGFPTNPRGLFVDTTLDGGVQYISNPGGASKKCKTFFSKM